MSETQSPNSRLNQLKNRLRSSMQNQSNLSTRIMTAVPAALIAIGILVYGSTTIVGLTVMGLAIVGMLEFKNMLARKGITIHAGILVGSTVLMGLGVILDQTNGLNLALLISVLTLFFYYLLFTPIPNTSGLQPIGLGVWGMVWLSWSFNHLTLIKDMPDGTALIFFLIFAIWAGDTLAYFGGKAMGKRPLAPSISPKKTIEGSISGAIGSGIVGVIFSACFLSFTWWQAFLLAMIIGILEQMGDLVESKLKRLCDIKDSGNFFPGHGGVLDRLDGFFTTVPLFYYLMLLIA